MKFLIPIFFFCCLSFSQTKDSINTKVKTISLFNYKLDSVSNLKPNFDYHFKNTNANLFSVYDHNTKLNNVYYLSNNSVYFVKSVNLNANQLMPQDYFNPNGGNDFGAALIIGALNTVFNVRFK